jgi:cell wall-associated NlpC family hydrolase
MQVLVGRLVVRYVLPVALVVCLLALGLFMALAARATGGSGGDPLLPAVSSAASTVGAIPPSLLGVYRAAAADECPDLSWQVLAGIGWVESRQAEGRADPATGEVDPPIIGPALDGLDGTELIADPTSADGYAHAEGPMQFLPATFARYGTLAPGRPAGARPDPENAWDAIFSAARMLCADGAARGDTDQAILAYNDSQTYLDDVLAAAEAYGLDESGAESGVAPAEPAVGTGPDLGSVQGAPRPGPIFIGDASRVLAFAESQLGVPYVFGEEIPGRGLDCSALVQLAYQTVGVRLPRTTFQQVTYGYSVSIASLQPGDLLFFAGGTPVEQYGHVAIYLGGGRMIQAPHTGAVVDIVDAPLGSVEIARRILL